VSAGIEVVLLTTGRVMFAVLSFAEGVATVGTAGEYVRTSIVWIGSPE
jgi:hypothetical protein